MNNYEFREASSRTTTINGEQVRVVNFRGTEEDDGNRNERLNVDGSFTMPLMEYFQAGVDGQLSEVIRENVIERLTLEDGTEDEQPAE